MTRWNRRASGRFDVDAEQFPNRRPEEETTMSRTATHHRAAVASDPTCRCPNGRPLVIGTFRDQRLVRVERLHLASARCRLPAEDVDPAVYVAGAR